MKLKHAGITGNIFNWIKSFLSDRTQKVKVATSISDECKVLSGIPQGSILGPVLFLIYINDICNNLSSSCKLFADDTTIYNTSSNSDILQEDINKLVEWSKMWQLKFNIDKCKILHIGNTNPRQEYTMNSVPLNTVENEKDIGIIFDSKLNFDMHISQCSADARKILGMISRSFKYLDKDSLRTIITSLIRSKLEYGNVVWSPIFRRQSIELEKVQRKATRLLPGCRKLDYANRLHYLNLPTLKYRRLRRDLIQTFKFLKKIDNTEQHYFTISETTNTRNNYLKLTKCFVTNSIRYNFFSQRIINHWNSLSQEAKSAKDVNTFKNIIDSELDELKYVFD